MTLRLTESRSLVLKVLAAFALMALAIVCTKVFAGSASAHGYIDSPASRAKLCSTGVNTNCGNIVYEPQSLEAKGNFPAGGPADGQIAGAGDAFPQLNAQTSTRWSKVNINSGTNTFTWKITARHATAEWKYYITKKGWDPNKAIARADLEQFCYVKDTGAQPPATVTHTCNVPSDRTGYYVILGVWEVADTGNAFYSVVDVNIGGGTNPPADTTAPTVPTNLASSTITPNSVALSWTSSSDNVAVTGYKVFRGSTLLATVSGTSYTATGLTAGTSYTFTVQAIDAAGNTSAASNALTVSTPTGSTPDTTAPTVPGGIHVHATTSNSISIMWTASTDNVGVTAYRVYNGSTLVATLSGSVTDYTIAGLSTDTSYTFTVRAVDAAGNVSAAATVTGKTAVGTTNPNPGAQAWAPGIAYKVGDLVTYGGKTYSCRQPHTSLAGWEPATTPALWLLQ
ncbi:chitin-binding protein [Paenibacillus albicereus]|uniref:Chitin-binding protein n=1 Tax=Paenibacillus albicereus TaxID=2726185 RepID=A0A6H2H2T3_9BACL|nr:lytic polysaccharide monooxygenase [Paenibacillus albicereus]QJC53972.1 chitin-binding protein [Paenibacillus albicereus]